MITMMKIEDEVENEIPMKPFLFLKGTLQSVMQMRRVVIDRFSKGNHSAFISKSLPFLSGTDQLS